VQVCAQALCLEEMFEVRITQADLFYGRTRRRQTVRLDEQLHALTADVAARARRLVAAGITPPAAYERNKCSACSLIELCVPRMAGARIDVAGPVLEALAQ